MATPATTITVPTAADFARRIDALFPPGWSGDDARSSGHIAALWGAFGKPLSFAMGALQYAAQAARIQTSTSPELTEAAQDFFGDTLPRPPGATDAQYASLIIASLFKAAATRKAISDAITSLTGIAPRMMEPWNVLDTGHWNGPAYWNADSGNYPARWGNGGLRYQGFIESAAPSIPAIGPNNPILGWGAPVYWDVPGYFFGIIRTTPESALYSLINALRAYGTLMWIKIVDNPNAARIGGGGHPPIAPTTVTVTAATTTTLSVSWSYPAGTTGNATSYTVLYRQTGTTAFQAGPTTGALSATIANLSAGTNYDVEISAANNDGTAISTVVTAATNKIAPGPAQNLVATSIGENDVNLTWSAPLVGTPPFKYRVQYRRIGTTTWTQFGILGPYLTIDVTGLSANTEYEFEVITTNI